MLFALFPGVQCGPPPAPLNAKMVMGASDQVGDDANQLYPAATSVTYSCDAGFELIGYVIGLIQLIDVSTGCRSLSRRVTRSHGGSERITFSLLSLDGTDMS